MLQVQADRAGGAEGRGEEEEEQFLSHRSSLQSDCVLSSLVSSLLSLSFFTHFIPMDTRLQEHFTAVQSLDDASSQFTFVYFHLVSEYSINFTDWRHFFVEV